MEQRHPVRQVQIDAMVIEPEEPVYFDAFEAKKRSLDHCQVLVEPAHDNLTHTPRGGPRRAGGGVPARLPRPDALQDRISRSVPRHPG